MMASQTRSAQACAEDEVVPALTAAAAAGAPFDACFMDMHMARMHGDASLAGLRIPVIVCTANATSADVQRYRALGFCGYLGKPFTPDQMHEALAAALNSPT